MSVYRQINCRRIARAAFAAGIAGERFLLHASVDAGFFISFKGGSLRMGKSWLRAAFGKGPTAAPGLYKQKFDGCAPQAITDCRHLFASTQTSKMRKGNELR
jgi:hypothetical protein